VDKNRIWVLGSVIVMVAVVALGFLLGIQPHLKTIAAARADSAAVEAVNLTQTATVDALKLDFAGIDEVRAGLEPLNMSVPTGTEIPAFVNQLSDLAARSQVTVSAITVADAVAYAPVVATPAEESAPVAEDAEATEVVPTEVGSVATAGIPPVVDALITADSFASLNVQLTIQGDYDRVLEFVDGLQTGGRLFLVSGISTSNSTGEGVVGVEATISGLVYVLVPPTGAAVLTTE
jgi:nucleoid-associated protein YgaU